MSESELLENFLDALQHDPNVTPPDGLDESMIAFARMLVATRSETGEDARDRVWNRVLFTIHCAADNDAEMIYLSETKPKPVLVVPPQPKRRQPAALYQPVMLVATMILFLALIGLFINMPLPSPSAHNAVDLRGQLRIDRDDNLVLDGSIIYNEVMIVQEVANNEIPGEPEDLHINGEIIPVH